MSARREAANHTAEVERPAADLAEAAKAVAEVAEAVRTVVRVAKTGRAFVKETTGTADFAMSLVLIR